MDKRYWINFARWVAVLPCSLLAVFLLGLSNYILTSSVSLLMDDASVPEVMTGLWNKAVLPALVTAVFILAGGWAAPRGKFRVAMGLYALLLAVMTYSTLVRLALPEAHDYLWPVVAYFSAILGGAISVRSIFRHS